MKKTRRTLALWGTAALFLFAGISCLVASDVTSRKIRLGKIESGGGTVKTDTQSESFFTSGVNGFLNSLRDVKAGDTFAFCYATENPRLYGPFISNKVYTDVYHNLVWAVTTKTAGMFVASKTAESELTEKGIDTEYQAYLAEMEKKWLESSTFLSSLNISAKTVSQLKPEQIVAILTATDKPVQVPFKEAVGIFKQLDIDTNVTLDKFTQRLEEEKLVKHESAEAFKKQLSEIKITPESVEKLRANHPEIAAKFEPLISQTLLEASISITVEEFIVFLDVNEITPSILVEMSSLAQTLSEKGISLEVLTPYIKPLLESYGIRYDVSEAAFQSLVSQAQLLFDIVSKQVLVALQSGGKVELDILGKGIGTTIIEKGVQILVSSLRPDLIVLKKVDSDFTFPFVKIEYSLFVYNVGLAGAEKVVVMDILPDGLDYVPNKTKAGGWNVTTGKTKDGLSYVAFAYKGKMFPMSKKGKVVEISYQLETSGSYWLQGE